MSAGVLAIDVDGTLVARGSSVDPSLQRLLDALHKRGWTLVVATGRRLHQLDGVLRDVPVSAVLSSEGATITCEGVTLFERRLRPDKWRPIARLGEECGLTPFVCTEAGSFTPRYNNDVAYAATYADPCATYGPLDDLRDVSASLVMLVSARGRVNEAVARRLSLLSGVRATVSAPGFISVSPADVDKGCALQWLLRERIGPSITVAAGDSLSDRGLLEAADHKIVMPSAPQVLRSLPGAIIADPVSEGGIVRALDSVCNSQPGRLLQ